jgi:DNA invertase Pin-like site-specific DNA recombinase
MKTVIYARVSTNDQDLSMQLAECRRLAEFRGWEVVGEYLEQGVSGAKSSRPELERLTKDMRLGKFRRVLVWKLDRFGRNASHLVSAVDEMTRLKVEFVSMTENFDTAAPMGRAVLHILAAVAQLERDNIAERTKAGIAHAKRRGKRLGRPKACSPGEVVQLLEDGLNLSKIAKQLGVGRATALRRRNEAVRLGLL